MLVQELVDLVLADLAEMPGTRDAQLTCLEVGCGSGAISLSLLKSLPQVRFLFFEECLILATSYYLDSG